MSAKRILAACLLAVLSLAVPTVSAQEKKAAPTKKAAPAKKAAAPADEQAAMDMMMKLATPGPGHKKLDVLVGSWNAKNTMWMDPSKPPMTSEGTATMSWILGGRFLEQKFEGTFMNMPFSGQGYTGYDNYRKQYVATWMDSMGTVIMNTTGSVDPSGKVFTSTGKMDDPTTGRRNVPVHEKMTLVSNDEILFEMSGPGPDGKEFKWMEIRYTRKK